jgi:hypothetical protein
LLARVKRRERGLWQSKALRAESAASLRAASIVAAGPGLCRALHR